MPLLKSPFLIFPTSDFLPRSSLSSISVPFSSCNLVQHVSFLLLRQSVSSVPVPVLDSRFSLSPTSLSFMLCNPHCAAFAYILYIVLLCLHQVFFFSVSLLSDTSLYPFILDGFQSQLIWKTVGQGHLLQLMKFTIIKVTDSFNKYTSQPMARQSRYRKEHDRHCLLEGVVSRSSESFLTCRPICDSSLPRMSSHGHSTHLLLSLPNQNPIWDLF